MPIVATYLMLAAITVGVGADSPEDRWSLARTFDDWAADVDAVRAVGADELWVILDNWHGDGRNTSPWIGQNPALGVDHAFLVERAAWAAHANAAGVRIEVALFEEETFGLATASQRIALARAVADAFRGLDVLICLSEELPARFAGAPVEELITAIHAVDPDARVTVHNPVWGNDAETILAPLAAACRAGRVRLWGVSGQVAAPADVSSFLARWRAEFPDSVAIRVVEIGPAWRGIDPDPTIDQRGALWTCALAGASVRIYKGVANDIGDIDLARWSEAYHQAAVAQRIGNVGLEWRPDLVGWDGSCAASTALDELRLWWPDGDGTVALPAGEWCLARLDPRTGDATAPIERFTHAGGARRIDRPMGAPRTDGVLILRTGARQRTANAAAVLGIGDGVDVDGNGLLDAADAR